MAGSFGTVLVALTVMLVAAKAMDELLERHGQPSASSIGASIASRSASA